MRTTPDSGATRRVCIETRARCACVLLLLATGCGASTTEVDGYKCADFVRSSVYSGKSIEERMVEINGFPIDKQYAVFICGVQYVRPPQWEAAQPFAAHGDAAATFLVRKLPLVRDDITIENIVTLVGDMNARGVYRIANDSELARALERAVAGMTDQVQRKRTETALNQLFDR